ncbi:MAG TPA: Xaa-Pro peptidase family protein [Candidatus Limnocylindrales bacterium]|nr:Xaa-Pro peptidase family protein [Candidatus Limnocylindrales bacterium]
MLATERAARLEPLRRRLAELELDAILVSAPANIRYLSGFTGSLGYLLIGGQTAEIVGDSRYWVQMEEEAVGFDLVRSGLSADVLSAVTDRLRSAGFTRLGFEAQDLTVAGFETLRSRVGQGVSLQPLRGVVEELRMHKRPEEIERLRAVAGISSRAFDRIRGSIRPGLRERDLAFLLEQAFRELGADGPAFETIVASGERGALPHARPTDRVIERGDMIVFDFGARAAGYCADVSRTVVVGQPSPQQQRAIDAVQRAQAAGIAAMRKGATADAIDRIARQVVEQAVGREHAFGHGLGHGIGLEVHERPTLSSRDQTALAPGMVITNEPGVYVPGWGGVRIEDMVLVMESGPEVITSASREVAIAA